MRSTCQLHDVIEMMLLIAYYPCVLLLFELINFLFCGLKKLMVLEVKFRDYFIYFCTGLWVYSLKAKFHGQFNHRHPFLANDI